MFCTHVAWVCLICLLLCKEEGFSPVSLQLLRGWIWASMRCPCLCLLKINDIEIERVAQFNFLGLIISSNLKWQSHIDHISIKISRVIGIMYRMKDIYPQ